jgi:hypothetical protein
MIRLFGLEKLHNTNRSVGQLAAAMDEMGFKVAMTA